MPEIRARHSAFLQGIDPKFYNASNHQCGVCGGMITKDQIYRFEKPDLYYHMDYRLCIAEMQRTLSMWRSVQKFKEKHNTYTQEKLDYLIATIIKALRSPWGIFSKHMLRRALARVSKQGENWKEL